MVYVNPLERQREDERRRFWSVRSTIFAVLEVILALGLLVMGVAFRLPLLAFALGITGTFALMALYTMRPRPARPLPAKG